MIPIQSLIWRLPFLLPSFPPPLLPPLPFFSLVLLFYPLNTYSLVQKKKKRAQTKWQGVDESAGGLDVEQKYAGKQDVRTVGA